MSQMAVFDDRLYWITRLCDDVKYTNFEQDKEIGKRQFHYTRKQPYL